MKYIVTVTECHKREVIADSCGEVLDIIQKEYAGSDRKLINFFIQPQNEE